MEAAENKDECAGIGTSLPAGKQYHVIVDKSSFPQRVIILPRSLSLKMTGLNGIENAELHAVDKGK